MEIISKISLILGLGLTIINVINWLIKYFNGVYNLKKEKQELIDKVNKHEKDFIEMKNIANKLDDLVEINKIIIRYLIVSACMNAIEKGYIEEYELQSLEDLYTVYSEILHSNSYVTGLVKRVRHLEVRNGD